MAIQREQTLFFLGAGSMSEAMIKGIVTAGILPAEQIIISNRRHSERLAHLRETYGVRICQEKQAELAEAGMIIIAVKPFDMATALQEIAPYVTARQLVISVVAGAATETIEQHFHEAVPVVRAMPNTSSFVQASATALCRGRWANDEHLALARQLFAAIGVAVSVEETLMDAVTGLSGTGPAYFYYVIESLMAGGLACGLSQEDCRVLMEQTVFGVAKMLQETGKDPAELRRQVTSPNGTTMAAMEVLDRGHGKQLFVQAVQRATQRSVEMGKEMTTQPNLV
ncbi:pyrroline-5-carboxylate reductase [Ktedonobacter racemifer]|uniref:Pyrroline-5-carboxylate reductase n=1 Tax=Ktedonobacter racemifer DSM 44963 TaxID=485913 RepID=D6U0R1_KTERA|nr:pyrroline-5-carboxylate reductase [Ktedonobacter racemifer]EFH82401.1 pyrroline-5-carboxylate reductase [Ktedonobacter racemifer DSM 44963]